MDILLADNDLNETKIISSIIKAKGTEFNLIVINNGIDAADYLFNLPPCDNSKRPDIIILKDNLPEKKGIEILAEVKQSHIFFSTIVVIISEHPNIKTESFAYHMGVDGYFSIPVDTNGYFDLIDLILSLPASG